MKIRRPGFLTAGCASIVLLSACATAQPGNPTTRTASPAPAAVSGTVHAPGSSVALAPEARRVIDVRGADGVTLKVYEFGDPEGRPIVFVHGVNQAHIAWNGQLASELAAKYRLIAFDLRGHGLSDKPADLRAYQNEKAWADDLAAVIGELKLVRPVLVGWSFGGRVIAMYLRHHGDRNVGAVNFVDTVLRVGGNAAGQRSPQLTAAVGKIMKARSIQDYIDGQLAFVRLMTHEPVSNEQFGRLLAFNMHVPPQVFRAVATAGPFDYEAELKQLRVPTLVTHGEFDRVSNVANGRFIAERVPGARLSVFDNAGHMAFLEDAARFNRELDALAREANARSSR